MGSYLQFPAAYSRLKAIMNEVKPALVQTWMYHADFLGTMAARSLNPIPPVVWNVQHSSFCPKTTKTLSRWMRVLLSKLAAAWPDKIAVCSRTSIELHAGIGYPREKMLHIVNGADTVRFRPDEEAKKALRDSLGLPESARIIGMAGRNDPQKDYPNLFAAIREFQKTDRETYFIACGSGVTLEDAGLRALRASCPAPDRVLLLGPRQDMPRVYPAFDLATLSSAYGEGLPLTLCEAIACGLPGVVTDVGDSADVIGDCGKVVPPCDPISLASAWREMLDLPADEWRKLRVRARARAEERFALPAITAKYESLYTNLIDAKEAKTGSSHQTSLHIPAVV
jgi:glycosyltransferase involved in cell wall biosynthesis